MIIILILLICCIVKYLERILLMEKRELLKSFRECQVGNLSY
jgi:branched-subunit amino acid transport protein